MTTSTGLMHRRISLYLALSLLHSLLLGARTRSGAESHSVELLALVLLVVPTSLVLGSENIMFELEHRSVEFLAVLTLAARSFAASGLLLEFEQLNAKQEQPFVNSFFWLNTKLA